MYAGGVQHRIHPAHPHHRGHGALRRRVPDPLRHPARRVADLGKGGALSLADRSTIYDRELIDRALSIGKEKGIALQVKRYVSGGNDAGSIHKSGEGVRPLALSVPTRYLHSPSCVCALADFRAVRALTEELVRGL